VDLQPAADARNEAQADQHQTRERQHEQALQRAKLKILEAAGKFPEGETARTIRDTAAMSGTVANQAIAGLVADGLLVACEIQKASRKAPFEGLRLPT
jgi:hypothetical protein